MTTRCVSIPYLHACVHTIISFRFFYQRFVTRGLYGVYAGRPRGQIRQLSNDL
jgi:hypothetical protein